MLIYRLECPDQLGPYHYRHSSKWINYPSRHDESKHPEPEHDGIHFGVGVHSFGFKDLEQLNDWFSRAILAKLWRAGFTIAVYECDSRHVIKGFKQVAFEKRESELVENITIKDYLSKLRKSSKSSTVSLVA